MVSPHGAHRRARRFAFDSFDIRHLFRAFITRFCTHRAPHIAARAPRFAARAPRSGGCTASVARAVLLYMLLRSHRKAVVACV